MEDIKKHREWIVIQVAALRAKFYAPRLEPAVNKAYMISWADTLQVTASRKSQTQWLLMYARGHV